MNGTKALLKNIQKTEDKLSTLVTKLWKKVDPESQEVELAGDTLGQRDDNWNPTDLETLRFIISFRKISGN